MTKYYREAKLDRALSKMRGRGINDVPGLYKGEAAFLCKMARLAPNGVALEIGVRFGHSITLWARERIGAGMIVGIELEDRPLMRENIEGSGLPIDIIIGDSAELPLPWTELAFLFVDGDHRKVGLTRDMERYLPLVIPGGIVVFHDYGYSKRRYSECAVTELVRKWQKRASWQRLGRKRHAIAFRRPAGRSTAT